MADSLDWLPRFNTLELTTTAQTLFTVSQGVIRGGSLLVSNKTSSPATVTIYKIPSGGPVAGDDGTNLHVGHSVPANDYIELPLPKIGATTTISALASANNALEISDHNILVRV